jgi:hypothetical protein
VVFDEIFYPWGFMKISSIALLLLLTACTCPFQHKNGEHSIERHTIEKNIHPVTQPTPIHISPVISMVPPVATPAIITTTPSVQILSPVVK